MTNMDGIDMNERIKQLSDKASDFAQQYVEECKTHGYYIEYDEFERRFETKFAELIIRECLDVMKNTEVPTGNKPALSMVMRKIEEHFGVK